MKLDFDSGWSAKIDEGADTDGRHWCVVHLQPALDSGDPGGLADSLQPALHEQGATRVIVDLQKVSFLGSSLISELIRLHKRSIMAGGELRLIAFQPHCFEALQISRLDEVFNHYLDLAEALE